VKGWPFILLFLAFAGLLQAGEQSIVLYEQPNFQGASVTLTDSVSDAYTLDLEELGSIFLPPGYKLELFENPSFQGHPVSTRQSLSNMQYTRLSKLFPGSIKVTWLGLSWPDLPVDTTVGVTLFSEPQLKGDYQLFTNSSRSFAGSNFAKTKVLSMTVAPGYEAALFSRKGFRGRRLFLEAGTYDIENTVLARFPVRSLRVNQILRSEERMAAAQATLPPKAPDVLVIPPVNLFLEIDGQAEEVVAVAAGLYLVGMLMNKVHDRSVQRHYEKHPARHRNPVLLYSGRNYGGQLETCYQNVKDMRKTNLGDNRVNSVRVPPGYEVLLYGGKRWKGRCVILSESCEDLTQTELGASAVSSILIRELVNAENL